MFRAKLKFLSQQQFQISIFDCEMCPKIFLVKSLSFFHLTTTAINGWRLYKSVRNVIVATRFDVFFVLLNIVVTCIEMRIKKSKMLFAKEKKGKRFGGEKSLKKHGK